MDSVEYFERAERANRRVRRTIIIILLIMCAAQFAVILILFQINSNNHDQGVENQRITNANFEAYFKCVEDEAYALPVDVRPTQAQVDKVLNDCANATTRPIKSGS